jgi:inner membrane protein
MDNLCHTLVGAVLAETGLKRRTPLATAVLVIGANLADVDVLAYAWGPDVALGFRRGWTHGVLALAVGPFLLTGLLLAWDRLVRRRRHPDAGPADPKALLLLSAIALLTHPFLDWLNTYGLRWLMPFRDVWYYGDVLFIVDPWLWLALGSNARYALRPRRGIGSVVVEVARGGGR